MFISHFTFYSGNCLFLPFVYLSHAAFGELIRPKGNLQGKMTPKPSWAWGTNVTHIESQQAQLNPINTWLFQPWGQRTPDWWREEQEPDQKRWRPVLGPVCTKGGENWVEDKSVALVASIWQTFGISTGKERKRAHTDTTGTLGPTIQGNKTKWLLSQERKSPFLAT